ncbi:MAG TPA: ubiquinol-cytochrome c reductase iron-sulfur subunit, partial [Dongiaceae bacterium]|nr:ubiquinol-cytochrome c reductase iron-sulfur subunit [Dongiaceae bacterium]
MADSVASRDTHEGGTRRDFLYLATAGVAAFGAAALVWPLIDQMNPSSDVLALASTEVDIGKVEVGQRIKVMWRGHPVFVAHRTPEEIKEAESVNVASLR